MSKAQGRNIAMVGASGNIGTPTVKALLDTGIHAITVISRADSSAIFPSNVIVKKGNYSDKSFLASALQGQDVLILQMGFSGYEQQVPLIEAAAKAGVRHVLPIEFGSDPYSSIAKKFIIVAAKQQYRDLIEKAGLSWIAVVTNPWLDWSLKSGSWGIDLKKRKASLYKGAEAKFNTTTIKRVGEGVAKLLSLPEVELNRYRNKPVYLKSAYVTQRELLESAVQATGSNESDWDIITEDASEAIEKAREEIAKGNPLAGIQEFYVTHMIKDAGGDYNDKATQDLKVLGLEEENLYDILRAVVQEIAEDN